MSQRSKKTRAAAAGVLAASFLCAVGCQTSLSPASPAATAPVAAASVALDTPASVDVCHRTSGDDPFILITVDAHAVPGHVEHGDGHPGEAVPGQPGNVFSADCRVTSALACPCWATVSEAQLVAVLSTELGTLQADCATVGGDVYARGINGNTTEIAALQTDMSCALRTSTTNIAMTSLPPGVFEICLAQARTVVPQLSACND